MKTLNKIIKNTSIKLFSIIMISFLMISLTNAISIYDNQANVKSDFGTNDFNGAVMGFVLANDNTSKHLTFKNQTYNLDYLVTYYNLYKSVYIVTEISNEMLNKSINYFFHYPIDKDGTDYRLTKYTLIPDVTGKYYLEIEPTFSGQNIDFYLDIPNDTNTAVYSYITTNKGISDVTETFINYTSDLININLGFWKLIYYSIIFIIIVTLIFSLIYIGWKIFNWASYSPEIKDLWKKKDRKK